MDGWKMRCMDGWITGSINGWIDATHIVDVFTVEQEEVHGNIDRHGGEGCSHPLQGFDLLHEVRQSVSTFDELLYLPQGLRFQQVHELVIHMDIPVHRQVSYMDIPVDRRVSQQLDMMAERDYITFGYMTSSSYKPLARAPKENSVAAG